MTRSQLLTLDSLINLGLGAALVFVPRGLAASLGIPQPESAFYPSVLGGVLCGIGLALWIERRSQPPHARGLGLYGAVAINLSGAGVLAGWLLVGDLDLPLRGVMVLWSVVGLLVAVSAAELACLRAPCPPL